MSQCSRPGNFIPRTKLSHLRSDIPDKAYHLTNFKVLSLLCLKLEVKSMTQYRQLGTTFEQTSLSHYVCQGI